MIHLTTPFDEKKAKSLKAGDSVLLSGIIYTGRDADIIWLFTSKGSSLFSLTISTNRLWAASLPV